MNIYEKTWGENFMRVLITGGAGFIGSNLAYALLSRGDKVTIYDNLSAKMVKKNLIWLKANTGRGKLETIIKDVRDRDSLYDAIKSKDVIFHLAAQTTVTSSISNPIDDFEVNTIGTINALEGIRKHNPHALAIYSSTNKVYGSMDFIKYGQTKKRFTFLEKRLKDGIDESFPLDFHSPYACSKGAADLYFYDYSRIYGLKTVVFRQSCIYGERQFGSEDQGWVMHFLKKILQGKEIRICGTGKQVRDILYIDDLISAYLQALNKINKIKGSVYNIGGGSNNTVSLMELIKIIEKKFKRRAHYAFYESRPGDQKIFFSDNKKTYRELDWKVGIGIDEGLDRLYKWAVQVI